VNRALPKDRNGRDVAVGSRVRVVALSQSFIESLPEDERDDVNSMVGQVFEVYEIDDYGSPWVEKGWHTEAGEAYRSHSLALSADEMEVVDDGAV
jgi:hypothetical protein